MDHELLRSSSLQAAAFAYWLLFSEHTTPQEQEAAHQWCRTHPELYASFVTSVEQSVRTARDALEKAWAPYSRFPVGAALLAADGSIWGGCNVECSSYGLTLCAERVALGHALVNGRREFLLLALVSRASEPLPPCGACRQLLYDFAPALLILSEDTHARRALWQLAQLLPAPFSATMLPL